MAVKGQSVEVVNELVVSEESLATLHCILQHGKDAWRLLKHKEISGEAINKSGETALDTAEKNGQSEIAALLKENGFQIVAVLIATVAFAAIYNLPGQYADNPKTDPPALSPESPPNPPLHSLHHIRFSGTLYIAGSRGGPDISSRR
nr:ankyrin repeat-containing protein At5g02620-like [Ipomoea batatas]